MWEGCKEGGALCEVLRWAWTPRVRSLAPRLAGPDLTNIRHSEGGPESCTPSPSRASCPWAPRRPWPRGDLSGLPSRWLAHRRVLST